MRVVLPDSTRLTSPPRRQRINPLLASAKRRRRPSGRHRQSACQILKRVIDAVVREMWLDDEMSGLFGETRDGNWHLQMCNRQIESDQAAQKRM
jgi:hypothetical protein